MPILVKSLPKYKCQYCLSYRAILRSVNKHEIICWQNPNRYCDMCKNTGKVGLGVGDNIDSQELYEDCYYCSTEDKNLTKKLIEYKQKG